MGGYKTAGTFAFLSAVFHVAGLLAGGFRLDVLTLLAGAIIWIALGAGLRRDLRWVAYVAFLFSLIGLNAALGSAMAAITPIMQGTWWAILAADLVVMVSLLSALWNARHAPAHS